MIPGSTGTLSSNPLADAIKYTFERLAEEKRNNAEWQLIAPEDRSFLNARGTWGAPRHEKDFILCVAERIYADPADPDTKPRLAYYDANIGNRIEAEVNSLNLKLQQPSLDEAAKADTQQTINNLLSTKEAAKKQMANLLAEAKLLFAQRGVDGEAEVIETIETIDAVLRNMQSVENPGMSQHATKFARFYSRVKQECEVEVGRGRNPFPMVSHMHESRGTGPDKERWEAAIDSVRPQVRAAAYQLNELLVPYAQPLASEARTDGQEKTHRTFLGKLFNKWLKV